MKHTFETVKSNVWSSQCHWSIVPNATAGNRKTTVVKSCKRSGNGTSFDIWRPERVVPNILTGTFSLFCWISTISSAR